MAFTAFARSRKGADWRPGLRYCRYSRQVAPWHPDTPLRTVAKAFTVGQTWGKVRGRRLEVQTVKDNVLVWLQYCPGRPQGCSRLILTAPRGELRPAK